MTLELFIGLHEHIPQPGVVPHGGEGLYQHEKALVVRCLIALLDELIQQIVPEQGDLVLVRHPEIGGQPRRLKVLPEQGGAEAVYGGDLRPVQQCELAAQAAVLGLLQQPDRQGVRNLGLHLRGGRLGEGHNEEFVDVAGLVISEDAAYHPFHQHGCLAGSGGGGDQTGAAPALNSLQLFKRPIHCHDRLLLPAYCKIPWRIDWECAGCGRRSGHC